MSVPPKTEGEITDETALRRVLKSVRTWALVLGGVGFIFGFFGPIELSPDANQGPLLGIFITGPLGFLLGAILGLIVGALRLPAAMSRNALVVVSIGGALVCLYYSLPSPRYVANVIDAQIVGCASPDSLKDKAMAYWDDRIAKVTWAGPRAGWKQDFDRMVGADPGVVLEMRVLRESKLYENRKPWDRGTFVARPWETGNAPTQYFARFEGGSCASYLTGDHPGEHAAYLATGENAKLWPAEVLSNFLDLQVLEPLPGRFHGILPQ